MKTPKEQLKEWLNKKVHNEGDKWNSGMKNQYFAWCDLKDKLEDYLNESR